MAEWRRGILEKRHQIAMALRVAYGGVMAASHGGHGGIA